MSIKLIRAGALELVIVKHLRQFLSQVVFLWICLKVLRTNPPKKVLLYLNYQDDATKWPYLRNYGLRLLGDS